MFLRAWVCVCVGTAQMYLSDTITSSLPGVCSCSVCVCESALACRTANQLSPCPTVPPVYPLCRPVRGGTHCALTEAHLVYLICLLPCAPVGQLNFEFSFVASRQRLRLEQGRGRWQGRGLGQGLEQGLEQGLKWAAAAETVGRGRGSLLSVRYFVIFLIARLAAN